jgi:uncharacterized protein
MLAKSDNPTLTPCCGLNHSNQGVAKVFCLLFVMVTMGLQGKADEPKEYKFTNDLIHSTSPYLLQHAHNPVNWMPWGPEAFAKAKRENKPIFVSIGYSTCFWCHVMERESFEKEDVAKILNDRYVAIKVDREQRPDIDEQLMLATQLLTGRGGWPNSVWLTTDGRPWMAGTYFPQAQFMEVLTKLGDVWTQQPEAVDKQADAFADAIRKASQTHSETIIETGLRPLEQAIAESRQIFDAQHGGFGAKPKFPPHGMLRLLAFRARESDDKQALEMLTQTLDAIWAGGIHDHVGGGFHRYSTDEKWLLPHFEKMLYDNAQLMRSYTEAYEITHDELYRLAVADIARWLAREMTHADGGFYSAIDSESDGEEGRYYTWSQAEVAAQLPAADAQAFDQIFHIEPAGNFSEEATGKRPGTNIPYLSFKADEIRNHAVDATLTRSLATLQAARSAREYPHLDDKVLTSWNGLMITSLAYAGRIFDEPEYTRAATRAAEFSLRELVSDGMLLRTWRDGKAELPGYLEDYAFLIEGLLELHQTTGDAQWLTQAELHAVQMLEQFEDREHGGFYFTGPKHETLIVRSKNINGGGNLPVANGVAAEVLLELFKRTKNAKYELSLKRTLSELAGVMLKSPRQVEQLVLADAEYRLSNTSSTATPPAQPDASYTSEAVQADMFVSYAQVAAGQELTVAVVLDIAQGYHLYGQSPDNSEFINATTAELRAVDGLVIGAPKFPVGIRARDDVLQEEITKLTGRCVFLLPAAIAADAKVGESITLEVELNFQACDNTRCLRPTQAVLQFEVKVAEQPGQRRNSSVIP